MSYNRYLIVIMLFGVALATLAVPVASAQPATCPASVEQALTAAGQNCDALDRNRACYGAPLLEADLAESYTPDQFDAVSDRVDVNGVRQIRSQAPAPQQQIAGTAVIKLQAMLPNTLPGQGVIMVIVGDTSLSNDTVGNQTTTPADPIPATATANANLRSAPNINAAVMAGTAAGETLQVDGTDSSNQWLRVIRGESTLWISLTVVQPDSAFDDLPVLTQGFAPMQAFSLSGGIGSADCTEAPDAVLIQNPAQNETRLRINGSTVTIGSSVLVEVDADNNQLRLTVLDGGARLDDITSVPAGYTTLADLNSDEAVRQWNAAQKIDDDLRERYAFVEQIPDNLLNYPVRIPSDDEIVEFDAPTPPTGAPDLDTESTPPTGSATPANGTPNNGGDSDSDTSNSASGGTSSGGNNDSGDNDSGDNDSDGDGGESEED